MHQLSQSSTRTLRTACRCGKFLRRFARDEEGALLVFGIYTFLIMLMVAGISIDVMHFERDRVRLQYTLDRSVLAAAALNQTLDPTSVVEDYLRKAGLLQYLTAVHVTGNQFERTVTAEVSADLPTQYMRMTGVDLLTANLGSTAMEKTPKTEISLLLDISGSMGVNDRISLMKVAAKSFTSAVLARNVDVATGAVNDNQTSINVIPFSGQTNPGSTMFEYLGGERFGTTTESGPNSDGYFPEWSQDTSNVVFWFDLIDDNIDEINYSVKIEGFPDHDVEMFNKDDLDTYYKYAIDYMERVYPPLTGKLKMLGATIKGGREPTSFYTTTGAVTNGPTKYNQVDLEIQFGDFYAGILPNNTSSCLEMTADDFSKTGMPTGSIVQVPYFVNWDYDAITQDWGWCPDDSMAIQYAQKDEEGINSFIDNLRLFDGTGTNYGMKYALALLDPNTQPAFSHLSARGEVPEEFASRPLAWDAQESSKYIVLMTDGRIGTQFRPSDSLDPVNSETELTARPSGDSIVGSSSLSNLEMFIHQCNLAKANGVIVYTVALEASNQAVEQIKQCASSDSHFFEVTGTKLVETFVVIASSIQRLRLIN